MLSAMNGPKLIPYIEGYGCKRNEVQIIIRFYVLKNAFEVVSK